MSVWLRVRFPITPGPGSGNGDNITVDIPTLDGVHLAADRGQTMSEERLALNAGALDKDKDDTNVEDSIAIGPVGEDGGTYTTRSVLIGVNGCCTDAVGIRDDSFVSEYERQLMFG